MSEDLGEFVLANLKASLCSGCALPNWKQLAGIGWQKS